jgi:hypothetical protein
MRERPSVDKIATALAHPQNPVGKGFTGTDTDEQRIDCVARVLHDSDLSIEALSAIVDGDKDFEGSPDDEKAFMDIGADIANCFSD